MNDDRDPIIDACLDEVLGGHRPPDVSESVLREWSRRQIHSAAEQGAAADPLLPPVCDRAPITVSVNPRFEPIVRQGGQRAGAGRNWRVTTLISATVALGLVLVVTTIGVLVRRVRERDAVHGSQKTPESTSTANRPPNVDRRNNRQTSPEQAPQIAKQPSVPSKSIPASSALPPAPGTHAEEQPALPVFAEQGRLSADSLIASAQLPALLSNSAVIDRINVAIRRLWSEHKLSPPVPITDAAWRQRVFQIVLGREPTDADLSRFGKISTLEHREQMVAGLMSTEPYLEEFARHWSEYLTGVFLAADLLEDNTLANRDGMLQYFRRALLDGRPFDRVAEDLLTATGSGLPGAADYNGAANYLLSRGEGKFEHATGDTSRLLLGRNVECQQCHDDLRNGQGRQVDFWQLNAFFRQIVVARNNETKIAKLTNGDFLGEDNKDGRSAIVFFEQPDGLLKGAFPAFTGQGDLPRSGFLAEVNRRELLARCVTTSLEFRQAITNRLWSAVYGNGLAPVDDLTSADAESLALLRELADQFAVHQFNPRRVIAWAVLSEPFAVPSGDLSSSLASRETALFHRFADQRPAPRRPPVQESLLAAAKNFGQNTASSATTAKVEDAPVATSKNGKIVLNSPTAKPLFDVATISVDPHVRLLLANSRLSNKQKAQHLFQLVLHRQPRRRELDVVEKLLEKAGDRPEAAWDSVWSALHATVP